MPAWMAGIQVCRMHPETSMSAWIPALHAGMTESRNRTKTDRGPSAPYFQRSARRTRRPDDGRYRILKKYFLPSCSSRPSW